MSKYVNKTQATSISPIDFINSGENAALIPDCMELLNIFTKITGSQPVIWGKIVGYGKYHYKNKTTEADWFITGFAPRKSEITLYIMGGFGQMTDLMEKLGKHKFSGSCLHIKKLADVDMNVLEQIIIRGFEYMKANYKTE